MALKDLLLRLRRHNQSSEQEKKDESSSENNAPKLENHSFSLARYYEMDGEFGENAFLGAENCHGVGKFGKYAFRFAKECQVSGEFEEDAFLGAENCHGTGNFEEFAFICSKYCQGSGEFGKRAFYIAQNCQGSGEFEDYAFRSAENCQGSGEFENYAFSGAKNSLFFVKNADSLYVPRSCIVIYKAIPEKDINVIGPIEGILMGVGYSNNNPKIIPIDPKDIGEDWDALQFNFSKKFVDLIKKYKIKIPAWHPSILENCL